MCHLKDYPPKHVSLKGLSPSLDPAEKPVWSQDQTLNLRVRRTTKPSSTEGTRNCIFMVLATHPSGNTFSGRFGLGMEDFISDWSSAFMQEADSKGSLQRFFLPTSLTKTGGIFFFSSRISHSENKSSRWHLCTSGHQLGGDAWPANIWRAGAKGPQLVARKMLCISFPANQGRISFTGCLHS